MERFITYMYAYENRQKGKNVGFVKVECRNNTCTMEIHIRNLGRYSGKCRTYLLMDENVIGVELGHVIINMGQGQATYQLDKDNLGDSGYKLEQVKAVRVECGNREFLASCWSEDASQWITQEIKMVDKSPVNERLDTNNTVHENMSQDKIKQRNYIVQDRIVRDENNEPKIERIDLADIKRLPATNWHYANNSFVIHGFMNYKYLVMIENNDEKYLGVPGVYEKPEEMMAKLFGFPEFIDQKTHSKPKAEGAFGYWISQSL